MLTDKRILQDSIQDLKTLIYCTDKQQRNRMSNAVHVCIKNIYSMQSKVAEQSAEIEAGAQIMEQHCAKVRAQAATIAQQAERIAELDKQCEDQCIACKWPCEHKEQAAMIDQLKREVSIFQTDYVKECELNIKHETTIGLAKDALIKCVPFGCDNMPEYKLAIAAIAAQKCGAD